MLSRWSFLVLGAAVLLGFEYRRRFAFPIVTPNELRKKGYDYVIVGAGSAGAALASRLSEDASKSVLLIEAGNTGASVPFSHIPGLVPFLQKSAIDWAFETRPQTHSHGAMKNRKSAWPRGKVLGGTSVLNYMAHVRARRSDYERWEKTHGLKGWGWADVEPFYRRMESFPEGGQDRGKEGPIRASLMPGSPEFRALWLAAVAELGGSVTPDYNGEKQLGWDRLQTSVAGGKRQSTAMTYLEQAKKRPNLHVLVDSTASRVLFDGKRASGVEFEWATDGRLHQVKTKKDGEVILSGGAVGSPHLLLLSGIGDPRHLAEFNIPLVADVPAVGQNLQDHMYTLMYFKLTFIRPPSAVDGDLNCPAWVSDAITSLEQFKKHLQQIPGHVKSSAPAIGEWFVNQYEQAKTKTTTMLDYLGASFWLFCVATFASTIIAIMCIWRMRWICRLSCCQLGCVPSGKTQTTCDNCHHTVTVNYF